jgi:lysophospholipase L1-like esterase
MSLTLTGFLRACGRTVVTIALISVVTVLVETNSEAYSRVRIGLSGDSIVEGTGVTSTTGLQAALRARLRRVGYDAAGWGYVPAHGPALRMEPDGTVLAAPWRYHGDWTFVGLPPFFDPVSPISHRVRSGFGADGHAAETASPFASTTARISGDRFAVLFARGPDAGKFRFSVDGVGRTVDAHASTLDGGGIEWVAARRRGRGRHVITVTPLDGRLRFTGVLSERTRRGSRPRVEVISLGHSCSCAGDHFARAQRQAVAALGLDLTLILFGTNDQAKLQAGDGDATRAGVLAGLRARGELARRHGGRCIIVPPAPNPRPPGIQREIRRLERRAAAEAGCRYAPILARLWSGSTSVSAGLTTDGIHPTPAGYERMALALAHAIQSRPPLPPRSTVPAAETQRVVSGVAGLVAGRGGLRARLSSLASTSG